MGGSLSLRKREERRKKQRIQLARGLLGRFGTVGVLLVDVTDEGARIEHFTRLTIGRKSRLRFKWQEQEIAAEGQIVSCKVHRFAHGDDGATVYQSGVLFTDYFEDSASALREMVSTIVARSLAEQVANLRGLGPVIEKEMPVFQEGVVTTTGVARASAETQIFLSASALAVDRGYICCRFRRGAWEKKWTRGTQQPEDGFTVSAREPAESIEQLCDTYRTSDAEGRKLIQLFARITVESSLEPAQPAPSY